ncbi:hypothetical protein GCM10009760_28880 [Kitasatospora kazusensis]|uniref:Alpha/beta hydrolase family protein n=1 Tax=Kitasatospora kazusensis TaxID=407974 RepID=A0ABN2ZJ44_9ACTN
MDGQGAARPLRRLEPPGRTGDREVGTVGQDGVHHQVDEFGLAGHVAVEGHRRDAELGADLRHRYAVEVTEYVRALLGIEKVLLVANSFGTALGLRLARSHPELYSAYVGTDQDINAGGRENSAYRALLERLRKAGKHTEPAAATAMGDDKSAWSPEQWIGVARSRHSRSRRDAGLRPTGCSGATRRRRARCGEVHRAIRRPHSWSGSAQEGPGGPSKHPVRAIRFRTVRTAAAACRGSGFPDPAPPAPDRRTTRPPSNVEEGRTPDERVDGRTPPAGERPRCNRAAPLPPRRRHGAGRRSTARKLPSGRGAAQLRGAPRLRRAP